MVRDRKLSNDSIFNWQGIYDADCHLLNGKTYFPKSDDEEERVERLKKDLNLWTLANNIPEDLPKEFRSNSFFCFTQLTNPFTSPATIKNLHDSVEELIGNDPVREGIIAKVIEMDKKRNVLSMALNLGKMSFIDHQREIMDLYVPVGETLERADSKILRDISDVFQSQVGANSPLKNYSKLLEADRILVLGDERGYCVIPDMQVDVDNERLITLTKSFGIKAIADSIQADRARDLLDESDNLLRYLIALQNYACKNNLVRPSINSKRETEIREGYNPITLETKKREEIVPHDFSIPSDNRVIAVTGPNMGGKSTLIQEPGLISLLAQAGSFVPAKSASVPIYTKIMTHTGSVNDIATDASLFQTEMADLNRNLRGLDENSLFICDELFRGTESGENGGARLHEAFTSSLALDYRGRTVLSSHYHDSLRKQQHLSGVQFLQLKTDSSGNPTYEVGPGVGEGGYAVRAALQAGIATKVALRLTKGNLPREYKETVSKPKRQSVDYDE